MDPFGRWETRRGELVRHAENSARLAFAFALVSSTGTGGEIRVEDCQEFGLAFAEKPFVSYGAEVDGDLLVDSRFPLARGGVYRWRRNAKGFYTGAWVYVVVSTLDFQIPSTEATDPEYTILHHFTFAGVAVKDLPDYLMEG